MSRTVSTPSEPDRLEGEPATPDWDALYPPDPDLMASAEGDRRGLAALKRAARQRIERIGRA